MKNERIIAAYDSIPMDPELSERLWEKLEKETAEKSRRVRPRRHWVRTLLLAAAFAVLMSATAYALGSIHQQRQSELREQLKIEENHVSGYVEAELPAEATEAITEEPVATLLSVLPDYDNFLRVYVNVSPVKPEEVRDGMLMERDTESEWDLWGIEYLSGVNEEHWQDAFIHSRDKNYTENELETVTDPEFGSSWKQPTAEARQNKWEQGYDPETLTLTLECTLNRSDVPEGETARLHIISVEYRAKIDAEGREMENDAQLLRDFGYVDVPLPETRVRTITFTEPRSFTVDGEFGPIEGKLIGAQLSATGVNWLYEIEGVYSPEDLMVITDELESGAVLELRDGSTKSVSLSVRSEVGPLYRSICGFAGTLDIDEVISVTAGGVHYDLE